MYIKASNMVRLFSVKLTAVQSTIENQSAAYRAQYMVRFLQHIVRYYPMQFTIFWSHFLVSGEKPFLGRSHFMGRSHLKKLSFPVPVPCSLFHKRKSVVPFKDSKNSNLISTFSLLHHFWICPLLSSNMSLSMFWLLRTSLTTILHRIFEIRKESCWVVSDFFS